MKNQQQTCKVSTPFTSPCFTSFWTWLIWSYFRASTSHKPQLWRHTVPAVDLVSFQEISKQERSRDAFMKIMNWSINMINDGLKASKIKQTCFSMPDNLVGWYHCNAKMICNLEAHSYTGNTKVLDKLSQETHCKAPGERTGQSLSMFTGNHTVQLSMFS